MNANEYVLNAIRTESMDLNGIANRIVSADVFGQKGYDTGATPGEEMIRLLHAGLGMATESGEFLDALKKHMFYGGELDKVNLGEEIGDQMWYIAIACHVLNIKLSDVMERNIEKLRKRYPNKFKEEDALNRDLGEERKVLEE